MSKLQHDPPAQVSGGKLTCFLRPLPVEAATAGTGQGREGDTRFVKLDAQRLSADVGVCEGVATGAACAGKRGRLPPQDRSLAAHPLKQYALAYARNVGMEYQRQRTHPTRRTGCKLRKYRG